MTGRDRSTEDPGTPLLLGRTIRISTRGVREQKEVVTSTPFSMADMRDVVEWPVFEEWERLVVERKAVRQ